MTSPSVRRFDFRAGASRFVQTLVLVGLGHAAGAVAQPSEPVEIQWTAPRGCPRAEDVRARVRELAGSHNADTRLRAEATITRRAEGGLELRLVLRMAELVGERRIQGRSCSDLADSAAIAVALLVRSAEPPKKSVLEGHPTEGEAAADGERTLPNPEASSAGPGAATATTDAPVEPKVARRATASSSTNTARRYRGLVQFPFLALGLGPLRDPSWGVAVGLGAQIERWRVFASGTFWLPQRVTTTDQANRYGAHIERYRAGVQACPAFFGRWFELSPCVLMSIQHVSASGTGPQIRETQDRATWFAAGLGAQARLNLTRWFKLVVGFESEIQTSRPTITIEDVGRVGRFLPFSFTFTFGPEWIL